MEENRMVSRLRNHDEEAFEYCYYKYYKIVYYVIIQIVKNREVAEEVMQDTFIKMYNSIDSFDGRYFQAWLIRIAQTTALNELKKMNNNQTIILEDYMSADLLTSNSDTRDLIMELEKVLSPDEFNIVIYKTIYNMTFRDIAEVTNSTLGIVGWTYKRAIKKFQEYYRKEANR